MHKEIYLKDWLFYKIILINISHLILKLLEQIPIKTKQQGKDLQQIEKQQGEGVVLRNFMLPMNENAVHKF